MKPVLQRLINVWFHLSRGEFRALLRKLRFRIWSDTRSYGLRRDLDIPFTSPAPQLQLTIRPIELSDMPGLFGNMAGRSLEDRHELLSRLSHVNASIPTCYLATTPNNGAAYMQWLMGPASNDRIQEYFNGTFPVLRNDEALLENAFTMPDFRGKGIMAAAMGRIAECARGLGARYVLTFVEEGNIASLKGCKKAGFVPHILRVEKWRLFRRSLSFTPLPSNTPYPFDRAVGSIPENGKSVVKEAAAAIKSNPDICQPDSIGA